MHVRPIHLKGSRGVTLSASPDTAHLPCDRCHARSLGICGSQDNQGLADLVATGGRRRWDRRQLLYRGDDRVDAFYKITKGIVAEFTVLADGRRQIVAIRTVGDLCGYPTRNGRHAFTAQAITPVEACAFNGERFRALLGRNIQLACAVAEEVSERLKQALVSLTVAGQLSSLERVAHFIVEMEERLRARRIDTHPLALHLTRQEIADYLGLTLETVSRAFGRLKDMRLIALVGADAVTVLDDEGLRDVAKHPRADTDAQVNGYV